MRECVSCGMPLDNADAEEKLCDFCKNDEYADVIDSYEPEEESEDEF